MNAGKNLIWTFAQKGLVKASSLVKTAILARIILKQQLGVFGIGIVVLGMVEMLTETGINTVLIGEKNGLEKFTNTAWGISIIRGAIIFLLIILFSPWIVSFFSEPDAADILKVFASIALVRGFINPSSVRFQKDLLFSREFYYRSVLATFETVCLIIFGLYFRSAFALSVAILASAVFEVIVSHLVFSPHPKLIISPGQPSEIISRGKWINGFGIFTYLFSNADNIAVGKLIGSSALGVYQYSYNVSTVPLWDITDSVHKVIFPSLVSLDSSHKQFRSLFIKSVLSQFLLSFVFGLAMIVFAEPLVSVLFGPGWSEAVPIIRLLSVLGILRGLGNSFNSLFLATGNIRYPAMISAVNASVMLVLLIPLVRQFGASGAAYAAIAGAFSSLPVVFILVSGIFKRRFV